MTGTRPTSPAAEVAIATTPSVQEVPGMDCARQLLDDHFVIHRLIEDFHKPSEPGDCAA
jgi:hypothetical protein